MIIEKGNNQQPVYCKDCGTEAYRVYEPTPFVFVGGV